MFNLLEICNERNQVKPLFDFLVTEQRVERNNMELSPSDLFHIKMSFTSVRLLAHNEK